MSDQSPVKDSPNKPILNGEEKERKTEEKQRATENKVRIAVLGATGVGKSSLCNLLCGKPEAFEVNDGYDPVTQQTQTVSFKYTVNNEEIDFDIIDCPGFFDTNVVIQKINKFEAFAKDIGKCIKLTKTGISVFLFVIPMGRLLSLHEKSIQFMKDYFTQNASDHIIFVFSKSGGQTAQAILQKMNASKQRGKDTFRTELVLNYIASIGNKCVATECLMNHDKLVESRDLTLGQIYNIHRQHGLFYGNVMWQAFEKQESVYNEYQRMRRKYYITALGAASARAIGLGFGLKYLQLKKENNEQKESLEEAVTLLGQAQFLLQMGAMLLIPKIGKLAQGIEDL